MNHVIELRSGSAVVASFSLYGEQYCDPQASPDSRIIDYTADLFAYPSGELWYMYDKGVVVDGFNACVGDGSGGRGCDAPCATGTSCGVRAVLLEPLYSQARCVPTGAATAGSACAYAPGSDGFLYADCAAGLTCYDGTCHASCGSDCTCITDAGLPPGTSLCE